MTFLEHNKSLNREPSIQTQEAMHLADKLRRRIQDIRFTDSDPASKNSRGKCIRKHLARVFTPGLKESDCIDSISQIYPDLPEEMWVRIYQVLKEPRQ